MSRPPVVCLGCEQEITVTPRDNVAVSECGGEGEGVCVWCAFAGDARDEGVEAATKRWGKDEHDVEYGAPPSAERCAEILGSHRLARDRFEGSPARDQSTTAALRAAWRKASERGATVSCADDCNTIMGWGGDCPCDCGAVDVRKALEALEAL